MVETVAIMCISCGKETGLSVDNINTNYNYIITPFLLNKTLHLVGVPWTIKTNRQLKYDIDKHNIDWITGGTWYNTSICKKLHQIVIENYIINARTGI